MVTTSFTDARVVNSATIEWRCSRCALHQVHNLSCVNVTTDGMGAEMITGDATGWLISNTAPGSLTCVDHVDRSGTGSILLRDTLILHAPTTAGIYNAYFAAYSNDDIVEAA